MAQPVLNFDIASGTSDHESQATMNKKASVSLQKVEEKLLIQGKNYHVRLIEIAQGKSFEAQCPEGLEATVTVIEGQGAMEIDGKTYMITPLTLAQLTVGKVIKFVNPQFERLKLCFVSAQSSSTELSSEGDQDKKEPYIRNIENCFPFIPPNNKFETIYELFGAHNGNAHKHSVAVVDIASMGTTNRHYHPKIEESYYFLQGRCKLILDEKEIDVAAGDTAIIPVGENHRLGTTGDKTRLLAFCVGPWIPSCAVYT